MARAAHPVDSIDAVQAPKPGLEVARTRKSRSLGSAFPGPPRWAGYCALDCSRSRASPVPRLRWGEASPGSLCAYGFFFIDN